MEYVINTQTNQITKGDNLGRSFHQDPYKPCTDQEIADHDLQEAQSLKVTEIKSARKLEQYSNITVDSKEYINTETAQNKFFNLLGATAGSVEWRLADNSWITLTRAEAEAVRDAIITKENAVYQKESDLLDQINSVTDIGDIESIIW